MIERYSREPMASLWTEKARYDSWLRVEIAALRARAERGEIDAKVVDQIANSARFTIQEIHEVEAEVHHDVIAFLTVVARYVGANSRLVHLGLTSSDVVDTAFALQIQRAGVLLLEDIEALQIVLRRRALEFRRTPAVGRTHGIHAEPTVFGLKFALWADEFSRHETRLHETLSRVAVGKLSGAVGNYGHTDADLEERVMSNLGIGVAPISTQVLSRDLHAEFLNLCALIGGTVEKIAVEIRHLQRTEVSEAFEPFGKKQKGSSAMPHKRNPILCERLTGMSRMIRGYALVGMENIALWHERDISHSSTERVVFPDACIALDYMLHLLLRVIDGLEVDQEQLRRTIFITQGALASEKVLHALIEKGWLREDAYAAVQKSARAAITERRSMAELLKENSAVVDVLGVNKIDELVKLEPDFETADGILRRLGILEG
ncbi:MAG: adenylosuccinate lyase [Calditrichaeota bacterium]|nr:adenylosuccinate lyase [Calditrichota bacterium]